MILKTIPVGPLEANCYVVAEKENSPAIIIDPGDDPLEIKKILSEYKLSPAFIVNTHGHYDHIGADDEFGVPVYIHKDDSGMIENPRLNLSSLFSGPHKVNARLKLLEDKDKIISGNIEMEVIHTPGHTPGGISLLMYKPVNKVLFSGDTLFQQGIGRTDLPGSSHRQLVDSIKNKLFRLADETVVYPGHGPSTTIGQEKQNNFLLE